MPRSTYISYRTKQSGYALPNLLYFLHSWINWKNFEAKFVHFGLSRIYIKYYTFILIFYHYTLGSKFVRELMKDPVYVVHYKF